MISLRKLKLVLFGLTLIVGLGTAVHFGYAKDGVNKTGKKIEATHNAQKSNSSSSAGIVFIAAALCVGFSSLAAGWAVSSVGSAAMGAISEKPELAGRALIFVGLAEGIAIYGLIIAIMLLGKV